MPGSNYLDSTKKQFVYYKSLADKAIDSVNPDKIYWQPTPNSNSIGILMQHMSGNMLSRFTDILTTDGEKDWRNRDAEFEPQNLDLQTLKQQWEQAWMTLFSAIDLMDQQMLKQITYIRNEGHTVLEAINRQLPHYAYHIGQIIYIAKIIQGEGWNSLSIAMGGSHDYNKAKFAKEPKQVHFIDVIMTPVSEDK